MSQYGVTFLYYILLYYFVNNISLFFLTNNTSFVTQTLLYSFLKLIYNMWDII